MLPAISAGTPSPAARQRRNYAGPSVHGMTALAAIGTRKALRAGGTFCVDETGDIQCERDQCTAAGAARLACADRAGHRVPPGAEGARGTLPRRPTSRCWVRRGLAWPEE